MPAASRLWSRHRPRARRACRRRRVPGVPPRTHRGHWFHARRGAIRFGVTSRAPGTAHQPARAGSLLRVAASPEPARLPTGALDYIRARRDARDAMEPARAPRRPAILVRRSAHPATQRRRAGFGTYMRGSLGATVRRTLQALGSSQRRPHRAASSAAFPRSSNGRLGKTRVLRDRSRRTAAVRSHQATRATHVPCHARNRVGQGSGISGRSRRPRSCQPRTWKGLRRSYDCRARAQRARPRTGDR